MVTPQPTGRFPQQFLYNKVFIFYMEAFSGFCLANSESKDQTPLP
jgi:hypothetical protein